jgi:hypothetical protein
MVEKWSKMVENDQKRSEIIEKWSKMVENGREMVEKWSKNGRKITKSIKMG